MALAFGWNGGCAEPSERLRKARPPVRPRGRRERRVRLTAAPLAESCRTAGCSPSRSANKLGAPFRLRAAIGARPGEGAGAARPAPTAGGDARTTGRNAAARVVVDVVAEGWGQGHARSSALGVAGMMAALAAAANGQTDVRKPHLVAGAARRGPGEYRTVEPAVMRWSLARGATPQDRIAHDARRSS